MKAIHHCSKCGKDNFIVNQCGCDPNNMPTKPRPADWQVNPDNLTAKKIQYWRRGIMISAQLSLELARERVRKGKAFIISDQAIGCLSEKGEMLS